MSSLYSFYDDTQIVEDARKFITFHIFLKAVIPKLIELMVDSAGVDVSHSSLSR